MQLLENVKFFSIMNKQIFERIVSKLNTGEIQSINKLEIDDQLIDKINKFSPIKHILKNKKNNEYDIIELLNDILRDLKDYDLEYRIQELESKFSKDLSETTVNQLQKELKKKQYIN